MIYRWLRNKSLRFKMYFFVSLFLVLIGALGIAMLLRANSFLKQELITRGAVIVRRLAESHSYQVSLGLADELQPILQEMVATEKGIEYVEITDLRGHVLQTTDGKFHAQSDPAKRPPSYTHLLPS